jgi:hypothetical protein
MRERALFIRTSSALLALFAAGCMDGCYGTPRTSFPEDDAGGSGGTGGSGGPGAGGNAADASDAATDSQTAGCSATCPAPASGSATGAGACVNGECRISCNAEYPTLCAASKACVDLMTDDKNCGTCGHDCLGGECTAGECQPVTIARYIGTPQIIYVGAQAIYITTDLGYVGRASKDGSDLGPVAMPGFASSASYETTLAEDGDRIFLVKWYGSAFQVSYCLTSGCDSSAVAVGGPYTKYFAVDESDHKVVWIDYGPPRLVSSGTLTTVAGQDLPGGALASGTNGSRLFYTQGGIYFADGNNVNRIPVAGGSIATVTSFTVPLKILGANSDSLFLYDGTIIRAIPLPSGDGGSPRAIIGAAVIAEIDGHFAADDESMYWVSAGQANSCRIANCSGTQRALPKRAGDSIWDLGIDDAAVYLLAESGSSDAGITTCSLQKLAR